MGVLVIGVGYIGSRLAAELRRQRVAVLQSSRRVGAADVTVPDGAALDRLLSEREFDQVVVVGQLTGPDVDWVIERIQGPRWVVLSSQQVTATAAAPGTPAALAREDVALARGACVLRPTMVYGRAGDRSVTRLIHWMRRLRVPIVPGRGAQQVQPLHVDDLIHLIACHRSSPAGGLYAAGGSETLPLAELIATLAQIVGLRCPPVSLPESWLRIATRLAPVAGIRSDQVRRLMEDKVVDLGETAARFGWHPAPLGLRLEQAVCEAVHPSGAGLLWARRP